RTRRETSSRPRVCCCRCRRGYDRGKLADATVVLGGAAIGAVLVIGQLMHIRIFVLLQHHWIIPFGCTALVKRKGSGTARGRDSTGVHVLSVRLRGGGSWWLTISVSSH